MRACDALSMAPKRSSPSLASLLSSFETTTEEPISCRMRIGFIQADPYPACLRSAFGDWSMLPYDPMSAADPRIIHEPITRAELADLAAASAIWSKRSSMSPVS
jgi:hypothetical protein